MFKKSWGRGWIPACGLLASVEGDGGASANGGGGGQQKPTGDVDPLDAALNNSVNAAVTKKLKKLERETSARLDSLSKQLETVLGAKATPKPGADSNESPDVRINSLSAKIEEQSQKILESEKRLREANQRERHRNMTQRIGEELVKQGCDPAKLKIAINHLQAEGMIEYESDEDDAAIVFKGPDGTPLEPRIGVKKWLETADGRVFGNSKAIQGSGSRVQTPFGGGVRGGGKQAGTDMLMNVLNSALGGGKLDT